MERSLPAPAEFRRQAIAFQKLGLNSPKRRKGFAAFAPHVPVPALWGRHKEVIAAMSAHKCAYCEGPINALRASHVEHFKPKSLFPLLAYEWTNYFLGCPGCNGAKGAKWPERGGYLRPDRGDPSSHFVFEADGTARAARARSAADLMLTDFDLNRKWLVEPSKIQHRSDAAHAGRCDTPPWRGRQDSRQAAGGNYFAECERSRPRLTPLRWSSVFGGLGRTLAQS